MIEALVTITELPKLNGGRSMVTEEDIKRLARSIWEIERCPQGKDLDHYFRAKRMLEDKERVLSNVSRARARVSAQLCGHSFES